MAIHSILFHSCVVEIITAMCQMVPRFIPWFTGCEKEATSASFRRLCGINGIIGAIDGCHIKIQRPSIRGKDYRNRHKYHSVVLQGLVDDSGRFRDINVGAPGRVHDSRILRKSSFYEGWREKMGRYKLLGDSAYICQDYPFILTPMRDNGRLTEEDEARNTTISRGRVVVENAFGR